MKSPLYWHPLIYKFSMQFLYGEDFLKKYRMVAEEAGKFSVLDVCCGDCFLANYIEHHKYRGIDVNTSFINYGRKKGLNVTFADVAMDGWPSAECIVILGSMYQFIPLHEEILNKAFKFAKRRIIVSEPISNLAHSRNRFVAWLARHCTSPGVKSSRERFTRSSLISLFEKYSAVKILDAGRELIGVFDIN